MPLSWNETKSRAVSFTNEWKDEVSEDAEAKSFWDNSFNVFGISHGEVTLYDPNTMPPELVKAHQALGKAVDFCYCLQPK